MIPWAFGFSTAIDGWLYLARPMLALGVILATLALWAMDRMQSRRERLAALEETAPGGIPRELPPRPGPWWIQMGDRRWPFSGTITIGRAPSCAIVLDDLAASALHATVSLSPDGIPVLEDLGSRNGTLWRGQLVKGAVRLDAGGDIQIGDQLLRIGRDEASR